MRYARSDAQGAVSIRRVSDDASIAELPALGVPSEVILESDRRFVWVWSAKGAQLWSLIDMAPVRVHSFAVGDITGGDISPDGLQAVVAQTDGAMVVHDLVTGKPPRRLPDGVMRDHNTDNRIVISPDNRKFAIAHGGSVEIRDLETGDVSATLEHPAPAHDRAWHPGGKIIAIACDDSHVHIWDTATGKEILVLAGFRSGGISPVFSHDGELLATSGWEGTLRLWDARTGKQLFSTPSAVIGGPCFSADDRFLGVDVRDGKLGLWELACSREYQTFAQTSLAAGQQFFNPSVHRNGRLLAAGMWGGVGLWDLSNGRELGFLSLPGVGHICFEPSGSLLTNGEAGLLRWPISAESLAGKMRVGPPPERLSIPGSYFEVACSGDGRVIVSGQPQGGMMLHAAHPDQPIALGSQNDTRYVAVSRDGKVVATSGQGDSTNIWDADNGKLLKNLPNDGWRVAFSPDNKWLGSSPGDFRLWEVGSWKKGPTIGGNGGFAFLPVGGILAAETYAGSIRLLDPNTGMEYARLDDPQQDRATHITFTPDGTRLIATSGDSFSMHVWDLRMIRDKLDKLDKMDLEGNLPPYPPLTIEDSRSLSIEIDATIAGETSESSGVTLELGKLKDLARQLIDKELTDKKNEP